MLWARLACCCVLGAQAVTLLGVSDHFFGTNAMVTIDSGTGALSPVRKNFSTWAVPDAAFDKSTNTLYACTRLHPPNGLKLGIVGYDRTGEVASKMVALDPRMAPDNLGAPHMDVARGALTMLFGPYNQTSQSWEQNYVEVDVATGATLRTVAVDASVLTTDFQLVSASDAYDAASHTAHQFYVNEDMGPGQVLASMNLATGKLVLRKTQIGAMDFCMDPVFYKSRIFCFNNDGFLVAVDVGTGRVNTISKVSLRHNIGVWYASMYQASASSPQLLYVTNTTNGGDGGGVGSGGAGRPPATRTVTLTDSASGATRTVRASPFAAGAAGAVLRAEARRAMAEAEAEARGDDDGFHNTHSSIVGFDMDSGEIVDGPRPLGKDGKTPVTWMNALDSV